MEIEQSLQTALDGFFDFLPNLVGFLLLLLIGYIVARVVAAVVRKLLDGIKVDEHLRRTAIHGHVERMAPGTSVSRILASVVFWLIFILFLTSAIGALKIPTATTFMNQVLAYLPNVIVAIVIFVIAALLAGAAGSAVSKVMGETPSARIAATVVPALVMVIALFMILDQLQIAEAIVTIAFAATMGALALGLALAFGLGGRDVARRLLEDAYAKTSSGPGTSTGAHTGTSTAATDLLDG